MSSALQLLKLYARLYLQRRTPVIVFSMQRTGSIALCQSLIARGEFVIGTHYLNVEKRRQLMPGSAQWASRHVFGKRRPVKIITLVRNPVENMASVFARAEFEDTAAVTNWSERFLANYLENGRYREQLDWFDAEFKEALGVDVYQHPFDQARGFAQFQAGNLEVLILRTEMDDQFKAELVSQFLNIPPFSMIDRDAVITTRGRRPGLPGKLAPYSEAYKSLKTALTIPDNYWQDLVTSPFAQHFFTAEELNATRARLTA